MHIRKRIKNRIIINNKNAVFAIKVFDSKKSLLLETLDEPNELKPAFEKNDDEGPDDESISEDDDG